MVLGRSKQEDLMRKTIFALLIASLAAGCDLSSTSLEEDHEACVANARKLLPTELTLTFARDQAFWYMVAPIVFKDGVLSSPGRKDWVEGKASEGQRTDLFYMTGQFSQVDRIIYMSADLQTQFDVRLALDPIEPTIAPDDGKTADFRVIEGIFLPMPHCTWEGR